MPSHVGLLAAGSFKPVLYYGKVGVELTKQVWTKEKLGPPALAEWPAAQKQLVQVCLSQ